MSRSWEEIIEIMRARQMADGIVKKIMLDVRDRVNGHQVDYTVPYWEDDVSEDELDPMTPVLIAQAVDYVAQQAATHMPNIHCPAVEPHKRTGVRSREYASIRRKAIQHTFREARMKLLIRRYYRHMFAYAAGAMVIMPPTEKDPMLRIRLRDPLTAYPDPRANENNEDPLNCGFVYGKSASWLRSRFPVVRAENGGVVPKRDIDDEIVWDVVEWVDEDDIVLGLAGPRENRWQSAQWEDSLEAPVMEIGREPNILGEFPGFVSNQVTLDKAIPQIANILPASDLQAKLMKLHLYAIQKSVEPDKVLEGESIRPPMLDGDEWQHGHTGNVNTVLDGKISLLRATPDPSNLQMVDRLERNIRVSTGLVPQAGGETYGSLRTGRAIDSLQEAAVDHRIIEMHEMGETHFERMGHLILKGYKKYYGGQTISMYSGLMTDEAEFEFEPTKHVETTRCVIKYPIAGASIERVNVALGQLEQAGAISKRTMRVMHPWVHDPDSEDRWIIMEALQDATLAGLQQRALQDPRIVGIIAEEMEDAESIYDAVMNASKKMEEMQAQQVPAGAPEAQPGLAGAPQPGGGQPPGPPQPPPDEMAMLAQAIAQRGGPPAGGGGAPAPPPGPAPVPARRG